MSRDRSTIVRAWREYNTMSEQSTVKFYGAMWCGDTRRARAWMDKFKVAYEWIDVDKHKDAEEYVKSVNNGFRSIPTIVFPDGSKLVEPSTKKLEDHVRSLGLPLTEPPAENEY
jgi:glutaredoxin-like protein